MRLLSIDWDYFFDTSDEHVHPRLWDWGHKECRLFIDPFIWYTRSAGFLRHGLPLPGMDEAWRTFWERFTFTPDADMYYSESHARIVLPQVSEDIEEVVNYDAHHDAGYGDELIDDLVERDAWDCGNWGVLYASNGVDVEVRYPTWKADAFEQEPHTQVYTHRAFDDGLPVREAFDRIFVCRSGAWVPPWCDDLFTQFIEACPVKDRVSLDTKPEWVDTMTPRAWNDADAQKYMTWLADAERGMLSLKPKGGMLSEMGVEKSTR